MLGYQGIRDLNNFGTMLDDALGTLLFDVWVGIAGGILLRRVATAAPSRIRSRRASLAAS